MNDLISIVVPVYRVEKYLNRCVDSILAQTYPNLEIILVDDGSDDTCPEICDEYANQHSNVRVYHKENGGLSDARNYGTERASGTWILFIDSDDYIDPDYIETMMSMMISTGADMVVGGMTNEWEDGAINRIVACEEDKVYDTKSAITELCYGKNLPIYGCGKIIPIKLAKTFAFPLGKLHEDVATTYKYVMNSEKIAVSSCSGYHYVIREGSILNQKFNMKSCYGVEAAEKLSRDVTERFPDLKSAANARIAIECNSLLHRAADSPEFNEVRKFVLSKIKGRLLNILINRRIQFKIRVQLLLCKINANLYLAAYRKMRHTHS